MKKFLAILLAAMMLLATAGVAFAEGILDSTVEYVEVTNQQNRNFVAYQIFAGSQAEENGKYTGALGTVIWGSDVDSDALLQKIVENSDLYGFTDVAGLTADTISNKLKDYSGTAEQVTTFAKLAEDSLKSDAAGTPIGAADTVKLAPGYYLIMDETDVDGTTDVANIALLQVTGTEKITIKSKISAPNLEKKVQENTQFGGTPAIDDTATGYNDTADWCMGDDVPFALFTNVVDMSMYATYELTFHDTMDNGLTFNDVVSVQIANQPIDSKYYQVTKTDDQNFSVTFGYTDADGEFVKDFKKVAEENKIEVGDLVRVDFTAKLNENAVVGLDGNLNKAHLEFSNDYNSEESTGVTPEDTVIVFTYKVNIDKVNDTGAKLAGAKFILQRMSDNKYAVTTEKGEITEWVIDKDSATERISDENGQVDFVGLDDGEYKLIETVAPQGYNVAEDTYFMIDSQTVNNQTWDATKEEESTRLESVTYDVGTLTSSNGQINYSGNPSAVESLENPAAKVEVVNRSGAILPSTGGIGTTLFYMFGGIMAAGSALMLVVRRRADAEEE